MNPSIVELYCISKMWRSSKLKQNATRRNERSTHSHNSVYGINIWCNWFFLFVLFCFVSFVVYPFTCLFVNGSWCVCVCACVYVFVINWYMECKTVLENYLNILYVIKLTNNNNNCDQCFAVTSAIVYGTVWVWSQWRKYRIRSCIIIIIILFSSSFTANRQV